MKTKQIESDYFLLLPCRVRCWIVTKLPSIYPVSLYIGDYGTQEYPFFLVNVLMYAVTFPSFSRNFLCYSSNF